MTRAERLALEGAIAALVVSGVAAFVSLECQLLRLRADLRAKQGHAGMGLPAKGFKPAGTISDGPPLVIGKDFHTGREAYLGPYSYPGWIDPADNVCAFIDNHGVMRVEKPGPAKDPVDDAKDVLAKVIQMIDRLVPKDTA